MQDTNKIKHHAQLLDQTAERLGVDLQEAAIRGDMHFGEIADALMRCMQCSNPKDCASRLAKDDTGAKVPLQYCENADMLIRLQKVGA